MMDQYDLEEALKKLGFTQRDYSIGTMKEDAFVLLSEERMWKTFYVERGRRVSERRFESLDAACRDILARAESMRGTYNGPPY